MALNYLWYFASFLKLRKRIADCICSYITSFIPIDVLCDTFVSANIWLIMLHDHLHCLVFKEHLAVALASQLLYITSRRLLCQEFFQILFSKQLLSEVVCGAVLSLSAADLHYITRFARVCQHLFVKNWRRRKISVPPNRYGDAMNYCCFCSPNHFAKILSYSPLSLSFLSASLIFVRSSVLPFATAMP